MIFDLVRDFSDVLGAMPQEHPRHRILKLLDEAIRRDVHFIDRHPTTFFQCMWNTCWWYDCSEVAEDNFSSNDESVGEEKKNIARAPTLHRLLEEMRQLRSPSTSWLRSLLPPRWTLGATLSSVLSGHQAGLSALAYSSDGNLLASAGYDNTIKIWDIQSTRVLSSIEGHIEPISSVSFSPNGKRVASASWDKTVRIWDSYSGEKILQIELPTGLISSVQYSYDGQHLAVARSDGAVSVRNAKTGDERLLLVGHSGSVTSAIFGGQDQFLVTGADDKTVRLWNVESGHEIACLVGHESTVNAVACSPDGSQIASAAGPMSYRSGTENDFSVRIWDVNSCIEIRRFLGHTAPVSSVQFSPCGDFVASAQGDLINVWNVHSGKINWKAEGRLLAYSPSGNDLATDSGMSSGNIRIWRLKQAAVNRTSGDTAKAFAVAPDGEYIATISEGPGELRILDTSTGRYRSTVGSCGSFPMSVAVRPDGNQIVVGVGVDTIRMFDPSSLSEICLIKHTSNSGQWFMSLAYSRDGRRLAGGSFGSITIWDTISGKVLMVLGGMLDGHSGPVSALAFGPNGNLVSGAQDHTVITWDLETGAKRLELRGHNGPISGVAYSADGERIVSSVEMAGGTGGGLGVGIANREVRIWNAETGACEGVFPATGDADAIAAGASRYPLRVLVHDMSSAIVDSTSGRPVAWWPSAFASPSTHPNGRIWIGLSVEGGLNLFELESS